MQTVPTGQILPKSSSVSLQYATSFPELACTVWSTIFMMSKLSLGETFAFVQIHGGGSSGIGTFAIQMAKCLGVKVFITAGSEENLLHAKNSGLMFASITRLKTLLHASRRKQEGKVLMSH